ncbi:nuclear transport factor 2 family protein [Alteraurantiacibacter aquimixticola]|uniref:Nuclear transport factor 2 family protein n=1 Tax=Alteraurantiacibacter aquimixticola TaxID=2489173 RepID=A0A4T3F0X9_9SPHN|nr:nuclear transport factor 2 family protein [Alteraurantiacibacter aquimixticola]TIX49577.1 nuclear transport factor 2 family protein [Alteraurantiacibacter aquimixticola]
MKAITISAAALAAVTLAACGSVEVSNEVDPAMQEVMDRVAIEDMVTEYYAHLGGGDASAFDEYFTEDAIFDVNGIVANGRAEIEEIYAGIGEDATSASNGGGQFHMILSNPVIEVDGDAATASFIWTGIRNADISAPPVFVEQGREYDKLVKVDGQWKFQHRVVIAESGLPENQYEDWTPRLDFSFDDME